MHRTLLAVLTTLLLGGATLLSCSDRSGGPSEVDRSLAGSGETENDIQDVITAIFGKPGGQLTAANTKWKNIQKACPPGASTTPLDCQTQVFDFIALINQKLDQGKLKATPIPDTENEIPNTTEGAAAYLQILLLQYAGFDIVIDPDGDPEQTVVVICDPATPCPVLVPNPDGNPHSGVFLPIGACDTRCAIVGQKIDETVFDPTTGPLSGLNGGDLDQFPLFFSWSKQELGEGGGGGPAASRGLELAQGDFNVPVEIALCVVEEGPYAPPDSVVENRLQLAHPNPADPDTIEILDVNAANNVNLDCSDATAGDPPSEPVGGLAPAGERRLTLASPGKLGAAVLAFSPFAAVDPSEGTVTSLTINESSGPVFTFDGDVAGMVASISPDPGGGNVTFTVSPSGDSTTKDVVSSSATATLACDGFGYTAPTGDIVIGSGTHTVEAVFEGTTGFNPSTSNTVTVHCDVFVGPS